MRLWWIFVWQHRHRHRWHNLCTEWLKGIYALKQLPHVILMRVTDSVRRNEREWKFEFVVRLSTNDCHQYALIWLRIAYIFACVQATFFALIFHCHPIVQHSTFCIRCDFDWLNDMNPAANLKHGTPTRLISFDMNSLFSRVILIAQCFYRNSVFSHFLPSFCRKQWTNAISSWKCFQIFLRKLQHFSSNFPLRSWVFLEFQATFLIVLALSLSLSFHFIVWKLFSALQSIAYRTCSQLLKRSKLRYLKRWCSSLWSHAKLKKLDFFETRFRCWNLTLFYCHFHALSSTLTSNQGKFASYYMNMNRIYLPAHIPP